MIIFNPPERSALLGNRVRNDGWVPEDPLATKLPVLSVSNSVGTLLKDLNSPIIHLFTNTSIFITNTFNIFCETVHGDVANTIVVGAHLDSVEAGPGINDNASGSSTLLELILAIYRAHFRPKNKIIFAWWGAEEEGK